MNGIDQETQEQMEIIMGKELVPLTENDAAPFDPFRLQREVSMIDRMHKVLTSILNFERGRRLNLMWDNLRGPECPTFTDFMGRWFPEMSKRAAYEYMRFARLSEDLPNFRGLADSKGGWKKVQAMLDIATPEELEEFERTGEIRGVKKKDVEEANWPELKRQLKAALTEASKLEGENEDLKEEIAALKVRLNMDLEESVKVVHGVTKKCSDALATLASIPEEVLVKERGLRDLIMGACGTITRVVMGIEERVRGAHMRAIEQEEGEA